MNPIFSIITPSYNKAKYIDEMIKSVLDQTETNWELIIIDDCSTDDSPAILNKLINSDSRLRITLNNENHGANFCRNQGISEAKGMYIIFFDADDIMANFCLQQRVLAIGESPIANLWIFNMGLFYNKIGDTPKSKNWIVPADSNKFLSSFLKHDIPWSIMQSTWETKYLKKIGGFDLEFQKLQDIEIHTKALLAGAKAVACREYPIDVYYRIDENRKTFDSKAFLTRSVVSSIKFYDKFYPQLISRRNQKQITRTLFHALAAVCWHLRIGAISKSDFATLENNLVSTCKIKQHQILLNLYQKISTRLPFHLPGLKKSFSFILSI